MSVGNVSEWGESVASASAVGKRETTSSSSSRDAARGLFDEAAALIPQNFHHSFTTSNNLKRRLERVLEQPGDATVQVLVTGVTEERVDAAIRSLPHRLMRVWYEQDANAAIIRFMPSPIHNTTTPEFYHYIINRVQQILGHDFFSMCLVGTSRFHVPGKGNKEGDGGMKCATRKGSTTWPNLMIEVGYSETLPQLQMNAKWWLINSQGLTRMVILINVTAHPNSLHFEVWKLQENPNRRITRQSSLAIPTNIHTIKIDAAGVVAPPNTYLIIPYDVLFDNPHPNATDITLTADELSRIALHIYEFY
ncbi:hypothetical protein RUND412_001613 [Rhizina undulata]